MNDRHDKLEREISLIPTPTPSQELDQRIFETLCSVRRNQTNGLQPPDVTRHSFFSFRAAVQTIAVCLLCLLSFAAGRTYETHTPSQASPSTNEKRKPYLVIVDVEPAAQAGFQSLVFSSPHAETVFGPTKDLDLKLVRNE